MSKAGSRIFQGARDALAYAKGEVGTAEYGIHIPPELPGDTDAGQAWQELKTLLETRIHDGLAGKISTKSIGEILDEELNEGDA